MQQHAVRICLDGLGCAAHVAWCQAHRKIWLNNSARGVYMPYVQGT
jgi:hypothetical protein